MDDRADDRPIASPDRECLVFVLSLKADQGHRSSFNPRHIDTAFPTPDGEGSRDFRSGKYELARLSQE
jgi:hypothetical protein